MGGGVWDDGGMDRVRVGWLALACVVFGVGVVCLGWWWRGRVVADNAAADLSAAILGGGGGGSGSLVGPWVVVGGGFVVAVAGVVLAVGLWVSPVRE